MTGRHALEPGPTRRWAVRVLAVLVAACALLFGVAVGLITEDQSPDSPPTPATAPSCVETSWVYGGQTWHSCGPCPPAYTPTANGACESPAPSTTRRTDG